MDLQAWVGRSETLDDGLRPAVAAAMAASLDLTDVGTAPGDPLPALWHWLFFHVVRRRAELGRDGHPAVGGFLPPVALPRRMWAGGRLTFGPPLTLGAQARKVSTVQAVRETAGRSGALTFVTVGHRVTDAAGGLVEEEQDIVYREQPPPGDRAAPPPKFPEHEAEWREAVRPDPVLLFRYSALTFNGHRIHYDADFCREEEGYEGLVVHGPLIATLLLDLPRRRLPGLAVRRFAFRAVSPLFCPHPFSVCGRRDGETLHLWAENHRGELAMTAEAVVG